MTGFSSIYKGNRMDSFLYNYFTEETRLFMADMLWLKVDQYHHADSGIKDIMALSKAVFTLNPHHIESILLYAHFLASDYDDYDKAVDILKNAIKNNKDNQKLDRLYAQLGMIKFFYKQDLKSAKDDFMNALHFYKDNNEDSYLFYPNNYVRFLYYISCINKNKKEEKRFLNFYTKISGETLPKADIIRKDFKNIVKNTKKRLIKSVHQEFERHHHEEEAMKGEENAINYSYHKIRALPFQDNGRHKMEKQMYFIIAIIILLGIYEKRNSNRKTY